MYAFVALFGLLALLTQLRAIRNRSMVQLGARTSSPPPRCCGRTTSALLLIGVQQLIFVGVLIQRRRARRAGQAAGAGLRLLARRARDAARAARGVRAQAVRRRRRPRPARRAGPTTRCPSTPSSRNMAWALWGYHPDAITELLAAMWPLLLLALAAPARPRRLAPDADPRRAPRSSPIVLLIAVSRVRPRAVRGALLPGGGAAAAAPDRAARHRLDPTAEGATARCGRRLAHLARSAWPTSRPTTSNPRLYDFRGAIKEIKADAGPNSLVLLRAARHALRARLLRARAARAGPCASGDRKRRREARCSCSPRSRTTSASSTGRTRWWASSTSTGGCVQQFKTAADRGLGVPMSSRPWDVRLRQVTWEPVPNVGQRPHAGAHHDRSSACPWPSGTSAGCSTRTAIGTPFLYGILIAAELFNLIQALGFWWTCANERVRESRSRRPAAWPSTCSCPSTRSRSDIVDLTVAAAAGLRGAEVRVWVLDDGNDDDMRDLAARHGVGYIRRDEHTGAKAGNINNALTLTDARVHRRLRLRPRGGPRRSSRPRSGTWTTPRSRSSRRRSTTPTRDGQPHRGGVVGAAGAVLRRHRPRQGRARRRLLLRHQRAVPPRGVRERRRASRPTRSPRTSSSRSTCTRRAGSRPTCRTCSSRGLGPEDMAAYVSQQQRWAQGLPVRPPARAASEAPAAAEGAVPAVGARTSSPGWTVLIYMSFPVVRLLGGGQPHRRHHRARVPAALRALLRRGADDGRARRRGLVHLRRLRAAAANFWIHILSTIYTVLRKEGSFVVTPKKGAGARQPRAVMPALVVVGILCRGQHLRAAREPGRRHDQQRLASPPSTSRSS